jgi:hypothetical protein
VRCFTARIHSGETELQNNVVNGAVQKSNCRFQVSNGPDGKPRIKLDFFQAVPCLAGMTVEFELLGGSTVQQAKALAETANDKIIGVLITQS